MALAKALITVEHTGEQVPVLFNPEEYTLNQDNNFASHAVPGLSGPILQYVHGNMRTLEMELFFDVTDNPSAVDVRDETSKVVNLLTIDSELHTPPVLRFTWGSLDFRCVLASASQQFVLFREDGIPVRARVNVTFNEWIDAEREARQINRQTADLTKLHEVARGETLSDLAGRFYENARLWRPIALENDIADPLADLAGRKLRIPSLPFHHPESGEVLV